MNTKKVRYGRFIVSMLFFVSMLLLLSTISAQPGEENGLINPIEISHAVNATTLDKLIDGVKGIFYGARLIGSCLIDIGMSLIGMITQEQPPAWTGAALNLIILAIAAVVTYKIVFGIARYLIYTFVILLLLLIILAMFGNA